MTALFMKALPFTFVAGNQNSVAPISNANLDAPALVWRSINLDNTYCVIDLGPNPVEYDYLAFVGTNLRTTDAVYIRGGTTSSGIGDFAAPLDDVAAQDGGLPVGSTARKIWSLGGLRTSRYLHIDIVATGHPAGFTEVQRIVVGRAITTDGVGIDAEHSLVDQSVQNSGAGWTSFIAYPALPQWKIRTEWLTHSEWRTDWFAMLQQCGKHTPILFTPDLEAGGQVDIIYGRITSESKGQYIGYDMFNIELQITALAP